MFSAQAAEIEFLKFKLFFLNIHLLELCMVSFLIIAYKYTSHVMRNRNGIVRDGFHRGGVGVMDYPQRGSWCEVTVSHEGEHIPEREGRQEAAHLGAREETEEESKDNHSLESLRVHP
uniref:Uncharacterized protein n=1 Tax=Micrurus paraensis TaxID=1970185 RepID=A0A2D4KA50_9SAUR